MNLEAYLNNFEFNIPPKFENAKSLIIVAVPQPITRIQFIYNNNKKHCTNAPYVFIKFKHKKTKVSTKES